VFFDLDPALLHADGDPRAAMLIRGEMTRSRTTLAFPEATAMLIRGEMTRSRTTLAFPQASPYTVLVL
jgi:hypothetical protein